MLIRAYICQLPISHRASLVLYSQTFPVLLAWFFLRCSFNAWLEDEMSGHFKML